MKTAPCKNKAVHHLSLSTAPSPCGVCVGTALPALLIPAWDFPGQWDGPAEQGQLTARAWAVTPTVPLHMRLPGSTQQRVQDTLSRHLQHLGAFSTPVWVTAQQLQTSAKPTSRESRKRTAMESGYLFSPSFKNQIILLPPKPIHPPGTAWSVTAATSPPGKRGDVRAWMGLSIHSAREKTALWEHRSPLSTARASGCSAARNQPWKCSAELAPHRWQQLKLIRCLSVHLLSPPTNMQEVEKPWKGRELLTHFEFL